eukprot:TRINITY_DN2146_c1_g1_i2.p1 TRINITY_DN2146_c1_g1~~TRINITY_DN2146_c1_g1_i2.p1  ORF type:complete len:101 (+),score=35.74 TRINITY_DN2146_c1_g1_i2:1115-1417(+)
MERDDETVASFGDTEDNDEGKREKRKKDDEIEESGTKKKKRKGVMRRRPLPHHLFALDGMSDAMEAFLRGEISFSHFEDVTLDPFHTGATNKRHCFRSNQ